MANWMMNIFISVPISQVEIIDSSINEDIMSLLDNLTQIDPHLMAFKHKILT